MGLRVSSLPQRALLDGLQRTGRELRARMEPRDEGQVKYTADVRAMIALLQATLAGSSEGRGVEGHAEASLANVPAGSARGGTRLVAGINPSRPSLEPTGCDDWHEQYTAHMAEALRKQELRTARYKRKLWREAEAAREERRSGKQYGPDPEGRDPFRGLRAPEATSPEGKEK